LAWNTALSHCSRRWGPSKKESDFPMGFWAGLGFFLGLQPNMVAYYTYLMRTRVKLCELISGDVFFNRRNDVDVALPTKKQKRPKR